MASKFEPPAKKKKKILTGFGSFKAELADILTEDIILQLAIYFNYPPVKYDLMKKDVGRNYLMVHYMEERGQITETDITTLLRALKARKLHGIQKRVQTMFELHTGKQCTGDDQSMQEPEDQTGNLELGSKGSSTSDAPGTSSVKQPSTSASDLVVTTATIQDLSHKFCDEWLTVGRKLGIGDPKLQAIDTDERRAQEKVYQMLLTWKQSKGKEATCGRLGEALQSAGRKDLQEHLYHQGCSTESEKA